MLNSEKFNRISSSAREELLEYLAHYPYTVEDLVFDEADIKKRLPIWRFLEYVGKKYCGMKGRIIYQNNLKGNTESGKTQNAASWLFERKGGEPLVVIGLDHIMTELKSTQYIGIPQALQHCNRTLHRVVLHELAHIVLHWKELKPAYPSTSSQVPAKAALPEYESEAWQFAAVIIGMALGEYAKYCREQGDLDRSWFYAG